MTKIDQDPASRVVSLGEAPMRSSFFRALVRSLGEAAVKQHVVDNSIPEPEIPATSAALTASINRAAFRRR